MIWKGANRRQFPRIAYPCLIKLFSETQGQEVFLTHTENISAQGCYVVVKKEPPSHSAVTVEIDFLDEYENMEIEGEVAWASARQWQGPKPDFFDLGINFTKINPKDKDRLTRFINNLLKRGYVPLKPVL